MTDEKLKIALAMLADSVERGGRFEDLDELLDAPEGKELFDGTPIVDAIVALVRAETLREVRGVVEGLTAMTTKLPYGDAMALNDALDAAEPHILAALDALAQPEGTE